MKKFLIMLSNAILFLESAYNLYKAIISKSALEIAVFMLLSALSLIYAISSAYSEYQGYIRANNTKKINKKIIEFIEAPGETIILSRDLSWVTNEFVGRLKTKVENNGDNLKIFLPARNKISEQLEAFADVRYFGDKIGNTIVDRLTSRFTIIHYGTDSVRLTYPQDHSYYHINTEYVQGDPAMTLATDIVKLLDILTEEA